MSRQIEIEVEQRETARRDALVKALEYRIVGSLESQGIHLLGFAFKYDAFNCLMTIKAVVNETASVCFIGSDSVMNCILKADSEASRHTLRWRADKYQNSGA